MFRDVFFMILLILMGAADVLCCVKKQYRRRGSKIVAIVTLSVIFAFEIVYTVLFFFGMRLPNKFFSLFALICIVSNAVFAFSSGSKIISRMSMVVCALAVVFSMYFLCFVAQEEIVINGKTYIAEYENFTGVSKTLVRCYERRSFGLTEGNCALVLDCGIILSSKPDLSNGQYAILEGGIQ